MWLSGPRLTGAWATSNPGRHLVQGADKATNAAYRFSALVEMSIEVSDDLEARPPAKHA